MSSCLRIAVGIVAGVYLASCGQSDLYSKFSQAAAKQSALDLNQVEIWNRSPVADGGGPLVTAADNLEIIIRQPVALEEVLDNRKPVESPNLVVLESSQNLRAPAIFDWAGATIPWDNPDFKVFMAYYHVTKARHFGESLGLSPNLDFPKMVGKITRTKLTVFADEPGDAFQTGYDPTSKSISFFRNGQGALPQYDPVDEADAIYHEYGHLFMNALAPELVELPPGQNNDLDALQEGLADFYSASVLQDDRILTYFSSNAHVLIDPQTRTGTQQLRGLNNQLTFPDGYRGEIHLDGRVVSATLDDFRRYLKGEMVQKLNTCVAGSDCTITPITNALSNAQAFSMAAKLALTAFRNLSTSSTLVQYGDQLSLVCRSAAEGICNSTEADALDDIVRSRGLKSDDQRTAADVVPGAQSGLIFGSPTAAGDCTGNYPIQISTDVGYIPFPGDPGFANNNGLVDPCEVLVIFPKITNNTQACTFKRSSLYDIQVELLGYGGFTAMKNPSSGSLVESLAPTVDGSGVKTFPTKLFGWIEPGEAVIDLISNPASRWYKQGFQSQFMLPVSSSHFPADYGWIVRAPSVANAQAFANFRVTFKVFNSDGNRVLSSDVSGDNSADDNYIKPDQIHSPTLTVTGNAGGFCNTAK